MATKTKKFKLGKLQKAWIKALKSGKYEQTTGCLKDEEGYCCLGVCEMLEGKLTKKGYINGTTNTGRLSISTLKKYGFRDREGKIGENEWLTSLNDDKGWTFKEIAEFIEKNPEAVFTKSV